MCYRVALLLLSLSTLAAATSGGGGMVASCNLCVAGRDVIEITVFNRQYPFPPTLGDGVIIHHQTDAYSEHKRLHEAVDWAYLNGQKTLPETPIAYAKVQFDLRLVNIPPGRYTARYVHDQGYKQIAPPGVNFTVIPGPEVHSESSSAGTDPALTQALVNFTVDVNKVFSKVSFSVVAFCWKYLIEPMWVVLCVSTRLFVCTMGDLPQNSADLATLVGDLRTKMGSLGMDRITIDAALLFNLAGSALAASWLGPLISTVVCVLVYCLSWCLLGRGAVVPLYVRVATIFIPFCVQIAIFSIPLWFRLQR